MKKNRIIPFVPKSERSQLQEGIDEVKIPLNILNFLNKYLLQWLFIRLIKIEEKGRKYRYAIKGFKRPLKKDQFYEHMNFIIKF